MARRNERRPSAARFITFEGGEGAGKSTQMRRLAERLAAAGHKVVTTREPGGTEGAEAVRHVLLRGGAEALGPDAEAILFSAARADLVANVIRPALDDGAIVLCDRYIDSSRSYQRESGLLPHLERIAIDGVMPDLTFIFDLDPAVGRSRVASRDGSLDRFEGSDLSELEARREAFLRIAKEEPGRCVVIAGDATPDEIERHVLEELAKRLDLDLVEDAA